MYAKSATRGLHVPKENRVLHVSATGGLHSAKRKQSITCTPKVRLADCIVPKQNSITCTPKVRLEDCIAPKQNRVLHVRQKTQLEEDCIAPKQNRALDYMYAKSAMN